MTITTTEVRDEAHWHELRRQHIGASEVAILLGLSKFKTRWRLWHEKRGTLEPDSLDKNAAVLTGRHMEPALAAWAADKWDWPLRKVHRYIADTDLRAGASLDYETMQGHEPVEVKFSTGWGNDDPDNAWDWEGEDIIQAPVAYIAQVQHQLMLTGKPQGWLVGYCGGMVRRMLIQRSEPIIDAIRAAIRQFWSDVAAGTEPPVDWFADADGVAQLFKRTEDRVVELPTDEAEQWVRKLKVGAKLEERGKKLRAEAKGNLWALADTASVAMIGGVKVDLGYTQGSPGKLVTEEMVGQTIGGREGFRRCQIRSTAGRPRKGASA